MWLPYAYMTSNWKSSSFCTAKSKRCWVYFKILGCLDHLRVGNAFKTNGWLLSLQADRWPKAKVEGWKCCLHWRSVLDRLQICKQSGTQQYLPWKTQCRKRSLLKSLAQDLRVFKGAFTKLNNRFLFWNVILELGVLFSLTECVTQSVILLWHTSASGKPYFWKSFSQILQSGSAD